MTDYKPNYDTKIKSSTSTVTTRYDTMHVDYIDWSTYPFDGDHLTDEKDIERKKEFLKICEQCGAKEVLASDYGGWPRIWKKVMGVGMASVWPYWKPRPTVLVEGVLGTEMMDWTMLTGARIKEIESEKNQ